MSGFCTVNTKDCDKALQQYEKQIPFATSVALNNTLKKARLAVRGAMQSSFDRPTPYTLNSLQVIPSTKTQLFGDLIIKNEAEGATPPSVFLNPQVVGGTRALKLGESRLRQAGILPNGMFYVPGAGAKFDAYGNMNRGQIVQILSAAKAFNTAGYSMNRTADSFDRSKTKLEIFVGRPAGGRDPLGIYQRVYTGRGKSRTDKLKPLLIFVNTPHYKVRLPFASIADQVYVTSYQDEFSKALQGALGL